MLFYGKEPLQVSYYSAMLGNHHHSVTIATLVVET